MKTNFLKRIKQQTLVWGASLVGVSLLSLATVSQTMAEATPVELKSVSVMSFGADNVLFVGDSKAATIHAFALGEATPQKDSQAYNLIGIDQKIADAVGASLDQLTIKDLAVHPQTKTAYIAVTRGHGDQAMPVIVTVDSQGNVAPVNLSELNTTHYQLSNPVDADLTLWNGFMARNLAITDIDYMEGELFVAGLSNADFASTLYRIPYPFQGEASVSSIEMYHAVHTQNETRAPIRSQVVINLKGKPHLLGAYTCTPLVTMPIDQLKDGEHIVAKTIAELGFGNTPIDVVAYKAFNAQSKKVEDFVMVTNKERSAYVFPLASLETTVDQEGMKPGTMKNTFGVMAPPHLNVPLGGLLHIADQDQQYLVGLRREMETGKLNLISFRKGAYFRLSDHISEYMMPHYEYSEEQMPIKGFQTMLQKDEGYL